MNRIMQEISREQGLSPMEFIPMLPLKQQKRKNYSSYHISEITKKKDDLMASQDSIFNSK
jgi:hypothetical protein